ncbi:zinc ABC transporter substrate-binding protein [Megalodesulfovibrio paquesii]
MCLAARPGLAQQAAETRPMVLCSTTQVADFAREIAGDDLEIRCILAPGADPHTYSPTPADAALAARAALCLQNGLHLEGANWMATLARDAGKPVVTCAAQVAPLQLEYGGQAMPDPHAWFSPANAAAYVRAIREAFIQLDPPRARTYAARADLYLAQLSVLDGWIRQQVGRIPPARRVLVTSHDAFNYFCREYRFNPQNHYLSLAPIGWSTGGEVGGGMTPSRRAEVVTSLKASGARAVFVETSVNPKLLREIASEAGVVIGGSLYSDSMGVAGSAGERYLGMMRENVLTIINALTEQ